MTYQGEYRAGRELTPEADAPATEAGVASPPPAAQVLFGARLPLARQFAELLAGDAVVRGLVGPREAPRIWERHLLNCAALGVLIPSGSFVVDIGSGAGLPGIVLAVARPDLRITLIESLARRTAFLDETVQRLGLSHVEVIRARAEECVGRVPPADVVTARAVAALDRLAAWGLPLTAVGGRLLAIKGESAAAEVADHTLAVQRLGGGVPVIRECGVGLLEPPVTVIDVLRQRVGTPERPRPAGRGRNRR